MAPLGRQILTHISGTFNKANASILFNIPNVDRAVLIKENISRLNFDIFFTLYYLTSLAMHLYKEFPIDFCVAKYDFS